MLFRRLAIFAGGFELEAVEEVCADDELGAAGIADVLARLVEKSLVAVEDGGRGRRYRLLETVRMYARERLDGGRRGAGAWPSGTPAGRSRSPSASGARRGSTGRREPARRAPHPARARPADALRLCVALLPFWLRRIELEEARRQFAAALEAAPERTTLRAEALLAAAAIEFRSGTLPHGIGSPRGATPSPRDRRHGAEWRALQFLGEFGVASDAVDVAVPWLERALELARHERFEAAEAIGVHSLGVAHWILGDLASADQLLAESIERFRAREGTPDTIPSPLNIAEIRTTPGWAAAPSGTSSRTRSSRSSRSPAAPPPATHWRTRPAIARVRGDLDRARALLDESAARFEAARDDAGLATVLVRRAYLSLAEGELGEARAQLEQRSSCAAS